MGYDGSLKFDTEINEKGFSAGVGKIGSIAQTALGVFSGQMMTRAVDGIVSLGKAALDSKASLEQNLGGRWIPKPAWNRTLVELKLYSRKMPSLL